MYNNSLHIEFEEIPKEDKLLIKANIGIAMYKDIVFLKKEKIKKLKLQCYHQEEEKLWASAMKFFQLYVLIRIPKGRIISLSYEIEHAKGLIREQVNKWMALGFISQPIYGFNSKGKEFVCGEEISFLGRQGEEEWRKINEK